MEESWFLARWNEVAPLPGPVLSLQQLQDRQHSEEHKQHRALLSQRLDLLSLTVSQLNSSRENLGLRGTLVDVHLSRFD